jgi:ferric reductase like protein
VLVAAALLGAAGNTKALWYLTRGSGLVAVLLLTASVALGIVESVGWASSRWPRFITAALHKNVSLLATAFLGIHIVTAVADGFAPIRWLDAVVPFTSAYRPFWLGLGAVAVDLMLALVVTSLLRRRLGYRAWRVVHWAAYACWPVALLHGLGTGSDTRLGWVLLVNLGCLAAVTAAVAWRLASGWREAQGRRLVAAAATIVVPIGLLAWLVTQPLRLGWARRAGTPASLLAQAAGAPAPAGTGRAAAPGAAPASPAAFSVPFTAALQGSLTQTQPDGAGNTTITIDADLSGAARGTLQLVLRGTALAGGGVRMTASRARMGPPGQPAQYQGEITGLEGSRVVAALRDAGGQQVTVVASLQIDPQSNAVSGAVRADNSAAAGGDNG